ncbi:aminotransferase class IV family protein [Nioella nitratireducens]|uniref:aminotransferase class IV family protein n=1 Tax=Nioella nitratireducens TaxID=1287720 RepID=UPI0008FD67E1|nr:aminotransferase class IV family protein [Nioella nitratireducens]
MESPFPEPVPAGTRLIETFFWSPESGAPRLTAHLVRMASSAVAFGFPFDAAKARPMLAGLGDGPLRCRLTLGAAGDLELTTAPLPPVAPGPWRVAIHPTRLRTGDPWLAHKTTHRALYDSARAALPAGGDEWLFLNDRDELCEGTITNLLVHVDGQRITPPLSSGLLPGVRRAEWIAAGAVEAPVTQAMLAAATMLTLGNSLRGDIPAGLL